MEKKFISFKDAVNKVLICKLKTTKQVIKYYDECREKNKYNKDMIEWNYISSKETEETFKKYTSSKDSLIFDDGCGTGWVGFKLKEFGYRNFHCVDLSQKLLDTISSKFYQKLIKVDLYQLHDAQDNFYDAIMNVETFTFGHVKPQTLN